MGSNHERDARVADLDMGGDIIRDGESGPLEDSDVRDTVEARVSARERNDVEARVSARERNDVEARVSARERNDVEARVSARERNDVEARVSARERAPAERALVRLELRNRRAGHENDGFLSRRRGFVPLLPPRTRLAAPFAPWDELAAELPRLHRSLELRRRIEALPLLDASAESLAAEDLLRACALLAILSHAYWYVDGRPPAELPEVLRRPWAQARVRLGRSQEVISYIDLIIYNWKLRDPTLPEPVVLENLDLLFPTVGNEEERIFYLTQLEILARAGPIVRLAAAAQGAVLRDDEEALEAALLQISECLATIVGTSLPKINPNPYGRTHVDPVIWAKTVAPFAVPIHRGDQGPSGTSSPLFNTLDIFFGRKDFASFLGREIKQLRGTYPRAWQVFLEALAQISVARHVEQRGSRALRALWHETFEAYAGQTGFLGRHRMKVYGYLELAFKVGRAITIGGFGGVFSDRTWDLVDDELTRAQAERAKGLFHPVHRARVVHIDPGASAGGIRHVTLDVSSGIRYRGGDRCLVLPENESGVVARTLRALGALGDEPVLLSEEWQAYACDRSELTGRAQISMRELLRFGAIRPVSPRLAEALHARTQSPFLFDAIGRGCTERWELWELLELLADRGFAPRALWQEPGGGASESLSRLIPPQRFRVYSVSSAPQSAAQRTESKIELTVGQLRYPAPPPRALVERLGSSDWRYGTASAFLIRASELNREVPLRVERPELFRLPEDPTTPIVMFAGGSGVAPFRSFLQERARAAQPGPAWLFLSLRSPADFLYGDEFLAALVEGRLTLELACTRVGARLTTSHKGELALRPARTKRIADLMLAPRNAERLWQLAQPKHEDGGGAVFYVCGRSGFADSVVQTMKAIFRRHLRGSSRCGSSHVAYPATGARSAASDSRELGRSEQEAPPRPTTGPDPSRIATRPPDRCAHEAKKQLYQLVGDRRLLQEIHTDAQPLDDDPRLFDVSEIAQHNDARRGYWIVVDRVVYDVSEFIELHPGGRSVVQAYAGIDATHGFARAHHARADVDAVRESYRIGMVRTLSFDDHTACVQTPTGALTIDCAAAYRAFAKGLQLVVEMQNALAADHSFRLSRACEANDVEARASVLERNVAEQEPYSLLRAVETHQRFLKNYFAVLVGQTLPELWSVAQGLFFPVAASDWMARSLTALRESEAAKTSDALALHAWENFEAHCADGSIVDLVAAFARTDRVFLRALKRALRTALREFELHGPQVRELGAGRVRQACEAALRAVQRYYRRTAQGAARVGRPVALAVPYARPAPGGGACRVHTGVHWVLEDYPEQRLAVLRRTSVPVACLLELARENEQVLAALGPHHRAYGLVVDTRQARLRNDADFEDAMAKLRRELTGHFKRTAVLLESRIGELQVSRIERDERRHAIATRSESTAFKFAQGEH